MTTVNTGKLPLPDGGPVFAPTPSRRKLPDERRAITHKYSIAGHEGYITVGLYENGTPGEIFIVAAREGSTISGMMDTVATAVSLALQYGVPLEVLVEKFSHVRYEPSGFTKNPAIPYAKSITDYIFRWLGERFLSEPVSAEPLQLTDSASPEVEPAKNGPPCHYCGSAMVRGQHLYECNNCGAKNPIS